MLWWLIVGSRRSQPTLIPKKPIEEEAYWVVRSEPDERYFVVDSRPVSKMDYCLGPFRNGSLALQACCAKNKVPWPDPGPDEFWVVIDPNDENPVYVVSDMAPSLHIKDYAVGPFGSQELARSAASELNREEKGV